MAPSDALAAGRAVAKAVLEESRIRHAARVGLYAAYDGELPSQAIFDALATIRVPRLLPRFGDRGIGWGRVDSWDDLVPGRYGILEPPGARLETLTTSDVVLLPSVAFDVQGWRLGRGGGHYDRAFHPSTDAPWLVAVGYTFQWVADVPHDSHDRRVDAIVTEHGWVWCAQGL